MLVNCTNKNTPLLPQDENNPNPSTMRPKILKRQLHPWQQMSALNTIQRQLQHLNDHIEESHATLDSLESFNRNKDKLTHQLRTIREDLILLKRSLAWLSRFTNLARALLPDPYAKPDDFSFYYPDYFISSNLELPESQENQFERGKQDEEDEEYPPLSNERFRERMLQLPSKIEENRTIFEKDTEEDKQIVDEEIAYALPNNINKANFKETSNSEAKTSESFRMSSYLLPPIQSKYQASRIPSNFEEYNEQRGFGFLPSFQVYRKFKDLSEIPLDRHSFFDIPRNFRRSYTSFEVPIR